MSLSATHQPLMLTGLPPRSVFPTAWRVQPGDARMAVVANLAGLVSRPVAPAALSGRCSRVAQARVCKTLDAGSIPATASKVFAEVSGRFPIE